VGRFEGGRRDFTWQWQRGRDLVACELPATVKAEKVPSPERTADWPISGSAIMSGRMWGSIERPGMTSLPARIRLVCFTGFLLNVGFPDQSRDCATLPCLFCVLSLLPSMSLAATNSACPLAISKHNWRSVAWSRFGVSVLSGPLLCSNRRVWARCSQ
jgi:hypothetical protein